MCASRQEIMADDKNLIGKTFRPSRRALLEPQNVVTVQHVEVDDEGQKVVIAAYEASGTQWTGTEVTFLYEEAARFIAEDAEEAEESGVRRRKPTARAAG